MPILQPQDAPTFEQPDSTNNQQTPSFSGTIVAIDGTLIVMDVVEQPKDLPGTIVNRRTIRVSQAIANSFAIGDHVRVYVASTADIEAEIIASTRVEAVVAE